MILRIDNRSELDDADVEELVRFALDRSGGIERSLAVRVSSSGNGGGYASDRTRHRFPKWAGRARYAIFVSTKHHLGRDYPRGSICGHAEKAGHYTPGILLDLYASGQRTVGRWPIRVYREPREAILHTIAHEVRHIVQYDRDRRSHSEVDCERFAARVLDEWQAAHPGVGSLDPVRVQVVVGGRVVWSIDDVPSSALASASCPSNHRGSALVSGIRRALSDAEIIRAGGDPERPSEKAMRLSDLSLRPRPGETATDVLDRVIATAKAS